MADIYDPKYGAILAIPFHKTNVTTEAANEDCLAQDGVGTLHIMPAAGSVLGLTINASGAITAGSIAARVHSSGTEIATTGYPTDTATSTNENSYSHPAPGALRFAAGAMLGVSVSGTTTLDPTNTEDVTCLLIVALDPF